MFIGGLGQGHDRPFSLQFSFLHFNVFAVFALQCFCSHPCGVWDVYVCSFKGLGLSLTDWHCVVVGLCVSGCRGPQLSCKDVC